MHAHLFIQLSILLLFSLIYSITVRYNRYLYKFNRGTIELLYMTKRVELLCWFSVVVRRNDISLCCKTHPRSAICWPEGQKRNPRGQTRVTLCAEQA